jgi:SPP1 gp7 family putative phage head morphogenesis protein
LTGAASKRVNDSLDTMEDRINGALQQISAKQQTTQGATRDMNRALDAMGLSLNNPSMAETLVRTHAQMAFGAAQWQLNQDDPHDTIWGYLYATVGDDRVRPEHAELDGITLPKDDPIWRRIWTPNGWNCRCQIIELTEPQEIVKAPRGAGPDPGFDFNPGKLLAA